MILPSLAVSSPPMIRSKVDLPQPDGPRMAMKSLSPTFSEVGIKARVGWPPRCAGKIFPTFSTRSLLISGPDSSLGPGEQALVDRLEQEIRDQPDQADDDDAEDDLAGVEQRLAVG